MNSPHRNQLGKSSILVVIVCVLGLLAAVGLWWMLKGQASSGSVSSPSEQEWMAMRSSRDPVTRIRALEALGRTGNESNIRDIERLLNDPVAAVRDRAVRAIESLRGSSDR